MKKNVCLLFFLVLISLAFSGCEKVTDCSFFALDTYISINFTSDEKSSDELISLVQATVKENERLLSKTVSDSELYRFNNSKFGIEDCSAAFAETLSLALEVALKTDGAYDPTIGALISLWGIGTDGARVPTDDEIYEAKSLCGYENLVIENGNAVKITKSIPHLSVDLGGAAKGYIAQQALECLKQGGAVRGILSLGGNIAVFGEKEDGSPYKIAIRDPVNTSGYVGYVLLRGENYISVSGGYERYFEQNGKRYHHIIDPHSGYPAESDVLSAAVISKNGTLADCLSTALFVMGSERSLELYKSGQFDFEAVLILQNGDILCTDGIIENFVLIESN